MKDVLARDVLENELRNRVQVNESDSALDEVPPLDLAREKSADVSDEERRLIVLSADSEEEAAAFRAQIEDREYPSIADRVQAFRILAHRYSTERLSADRGGDVGFVGAADSSREQLSEQAFMLEKIGDLSMPYQIGDDWQVAMFFERRAVQMSETSAEDAHAQARRELFEKRRDKVRTEFIDELVRSAEVKVFSERVAELPLSPRRGMSTGVDSIRPDQ